MNRLVMLTAALALVCNSASAEDAKTKHETSAKTEVKSAAPDNTGKNVRDRNDAKVTSEEQSNDKKDVEITGAIRRAVVGKKGMSTNGQNVKIITNNGTVTLRGPVDSAAEKQTIESLAKKYAKSYKVVSELEVKTKDESAKSTK